MHENKFEDGTYEMAPFLSQPLCTKLLIIFDYKHTSAHFNQYQFFKSAQLRLLCQTACLKHGSLNIKADFLF